jgi:Putative zinc-finger
MTKKPHAENVGHDYVWELLPWYVNEGLSTTEVNQVKSHLDICPICQSEVARLQDLNVSVKSNHGDVWTPSAPHFARVLASVDAFEKRRSKPEESLGWLTRWFSWIKDTPRPARFTLGLQGALVVALATTLLIRGLVPTEAYKTLSNPVENSATLGQQVRLVFTEDMTEKELRNLLLGIGGRLVAGPSSFGVYTIVLDASKSNAHDIQQAISTLRAHPKVRLAEMASAGIE